MTATVRQVTAAGVTDLGSAPLSADFQSDIADFKDMVIGSVQATWTGEDTDDGGFQLWVSNVRDPLYFAPFPDSAAVMTSDRQSIMWNLGGGEIGFRYAQLRYTRGSATTGTSSVNAVGKKGGGL